MANLSVYLENLLIDSIFRPSLPTLWGSGVIYTLGQLVYGNNASAAGLIMECVVAGTAGVGQPVWSTTFNTTTVDNTVTWRTWLAALPKKALYVALYTVTPADVAGTEVTGGSYARVLVDPTVATNWLTTQGNTTSPSTGTSATTSNNAVITFPAPTANWGTITGIGILDAVTAGNILFWAPLSLSKVVNNGDPAPTFPAGSLVAALDN